MSPKGDITTLPSTLPILPMTTLTLVSKGLLTFTWLVKKPKILLTTLEEAHLMKSHFTGTFLTMFLFRTKKSLQSTLIPKFKAKDSHTGTTLHLGTAKKVKV